VQRHALGLLFTVLTLALAAVGVAALAHAHSAARWVVGLAALAVSAWLATVAVAALRR
jgi:hypothetical protein